MSNQTVQTVSSSNDKLKVGMAAFAAVAGIVAFYVLADQANAVRIGALVLGFVLAVALGWSSKTGKDLRDFGKEAVREAKKVVWPTPKETSMTTMVVFGFVLVMAIFLWLTDSILEYVVYHVILGVTK